MYRAIFILKSHRGEAFPISDYGFGTEALKLYSEAGSYDRVVIQELLKEIAQTQQVDLNAKQRFKGYNH